MKSTRLLFSAVLLLGLSSGNIGFAGPAPAPKKTYAIIGCYRNTIPASKLVEKAQQEIAVKMKGFATVNDPDSADQVVQVVFNNNQYQVDYYGVSPEAMKADHASLVSNFRVQAMLGDAARVENATGHGRGK